LLSFDRFKTPVINLLFARFLPVIAAVYTLLSVASAQTTPTPGPTPVPEPSAPVHAAGQIGPGTTGTISPAQGVAPVAPSKTKADRILNGALTPKTRQKLQEAMNTVTPPPAEDKEPASAVTPTPPPAAAH